MDGEQGFDGEQLVGWHRAVIDISANPKRGIV